MATYVSNFKNHSLKGKAIGVEPYQQKKKQNRGKHNLEEPQEPAFGHQNLGNIGASHQMEVAPLPPAFQYNILDTIKLMDMSQNNFYGTETQFHPKFFNTMGYEFNKNHPEIGNELKNPKEMASEMENLKESEEVDNLRNLLKRRKCTNKSNNITLSHCLVWKSQPSKVMFYSQEGFLVCQKKSVRKSIHNVLSRHGTERFYDFTPGLRFNR